MKMEVWDFLMIFLGVILGIFLTLVINSLEDNIPEGFTLIQNKSNEWYWLQSQQYLETQLNEYTTIKSILINNECKDGGFIENLDGKEFLIVCYEPKKTIKKMIERR